MDKQIQSVKGKKWGISLAICLIVLILIIGIIYLSPLLKQQEEPTETESPETFIFSDIEGEVDLEDIENAIKGALNQ